jgi:hypothetical protein
MITFHLSEVVLVAMGFNCHKSVTYIYWLLYKAITDVVLIQLKYITRAPQHTVYCGEEM